MEEWVLGKYGKLRGKMWRMIQKMTECVRSVVVLGGEISKGFDTLQGVARGCTLLRWTLVNRTYGEDKNLYINIFLLTIFGPIYYRPP